MYSSVHKDHCVWHGDRETYVMLIIPVFMDVVFANGLRPQEIKAIVVLQKRHRRPNLGVSRGFFEKQRSRLIWVV